jgi:CRP-like cAMP-binding protein
MNFEETSSAPVTSSISGILHSPLSRKLSAYVRLTNLELSVLEDFHQRQREYPPGRDLIHEGEPNQSAFILSEGWASSYKILPSGSRQIVDIQIPGDFLGLRSILFRTADHNVEPITPVKASQIDAAALLETFEQAPRLAMAVLWAASRDEAMVVEHLVGIGRRNAAERMAHFLLELGARLKLIGKATTKGYTCPLSQYVLADALGLTPVHVNRVLRELREEGLLTFQKGEVQFDDFAGLVRFANFDREYLDHDGPLLK